MAEIILADTVTKLGPAHKGCVLVGASYCGVYAAYLAARERVSAVILNDAGIGLEEAGIGGLAWADALGLPAAAADHRSCRIADAKDAIANGVISHVNAEAAILGCQPGISVSLFAEMMQQAQPLASELPVYGEARFVLREAAGGPMVVGCDSTSLLTPEDAGRIAVTASHGALVGGNRNDGAVAVDLAGVTFNDAGIGKEEAGVLRLAVLDERRIPAATVAAMSARIGDARSSWRTGVLSRVNEAATALGVQTGMTTEMFADAVGSNCSG
jgi:hypothetical protein